MRDAAGRAAQNGLLVPALQSVQLRLTQILPFSRRREALAHGAAEPAANAAVLIHHQQALGERPHAHLVLRHGLFRPKYFFTLR